MVSSGTHFSENLIDEVLAVYMKAPKSFTREDVVEIHSHSGFVVLDKILSLVLDSGAVLAEPGEFSKRAFLNGRIDLTQAEAIIDLINAPCEKAAAMASCQVTGGMKRVVENISDKILNFQAKCEAFIEFSDEIDSGQRALTTEIQQTFEKSILPEIKSLINKQKEMAVFKDGLHLSIGGVPNVGKSSLLNQTGRQRDSDCFRPSGDNKGYRKRIHLHQRCTCDSLRYSRNT
jgi:tRNA modification GTPase